MAVLKARGSRHPPECASSSSSWAKGRRSARQRSSSRTWPPWARRVTLNTPHSAPYFKRHHFEISIMRRPGESFSRGTLCVVLLDDTGWSRERPSREWRYRPRGYGPGPRATAAAARRPSPTGGQRAGLAISIPTNCLISTKSRSAASAAERAATNPALSGAAGGHRGRRRGAPSAAANTAAVGNAHIRAAYLGCWLDPVDSDWIQSDSGSSILFKTIQEPTSALRLDPPAEVH